MYIIFYISYMLYTCTFNFYRLYVIHMYIILYIYTLYVIHMYIILYIHCHVMSLSEPLIFSMGLRGVAAGANPSLVHTLYVTHMYIILYIHYMLYICTLYYIYFVCYTCVHYVLYVHFVPVVCARPCDLSCSRSPLEALMRRFVSTRQIHHRRRSSSSAGVS